MQKYFFNWPQHLYVEGDKVDAYGSFQDILKLFSPFTFDQHESKLKLILKINKTHMHKIIKKINNNFSNLFNLRNLWLLLWHWEMGNKFKIILDKIASYCLISTPRFNCPIYNFKLVNCRFYTLHLLGYLILIVKDTRRNLLSIFLKGSR